jgi:UDP-N-acetylmuramoyl-L-alanyl-D-glutamate--2,6-diaminopimelate ligase
MEDRSKDDFRKNRALNACKSHNNPSHRLKVFGVTGTNGKTTVTYFLEAILKAAGERVGLIGTVETRFESWTNPSTLTTPGSEELQEIFAKFEAMGATAVVMEVSSHALDQFRTYGTRFEGVLFTNLTQDHLDYHGSFERYYLAKRRLFTEYEAKHRVVFLKDSWSHRLVNDIKTQGQSVITVGRDAKCNLDCSGLVSMETGIEGTLHFQCWQNTKHSLQVSSALFGEFNVENLAVAAAMGMALGIDPKKLESILCHMTPPPGRLERVSRNEDPFCVFVDYAHTPDALFNACKTLKEARPQGSLIVIFGCGGDRDRTKRPLMAQSAEAVADRVVITSDNPRGENPESIIADILRGIKKSENVTTITDRGTAIDQTISKLKPGDTLLIAGKGHEPYQVIGTSVLNFDDRDRARKAISLYFPSITT